MSNSREIINSIFEKNLDQMQNDINNALTSKAVDALDHKKSEIAKSYFGTN